MNTSATGGPSPAEQSPADLSHPRVQHDLRTIKILVGGYTAISLLALVVIVVLRNHPAEVSSSVWIHGIIVAASALLTLSIVVRAARGSRGAYRRLRIVSAVLVVAIVVIIALPGSFPVWMKLEQGVCGALMLVVAVVANRRHMRAPFAAR